MKMQVVSKIILYNYNYIKDIGFRLPFLEYVVNNLDTNIVIFGYRGYGNSEGTPSEKGLKLDGLACGHFMFEDVEASKYIDRNQVFLFGRSLGGAVAAYVAMDNSLPFKGVIIENTFSTMGDLVDIMFPPLKYVKQFLLKSKFETIKIIGKIKKPLLFCRSENDELIPKNQMDELYSSAKGAIYKDYYVIKGGMHNDGFRNDPEGYRMALNNFFETCNNHELINSKISNQTNETDYTENNKKKIE